MDAEKVKEIARRKLMSEGMMGALTYIDEVWAKAEAAEQVSIKGLPMCGVDTRSIVGCVHGSGAFCKYRRGPLDNEAWCAFPDDEPAEDSEAEADTAFSYKLKGFLGEQLKALDEEIKVYFDALHDRCDALRAAQVAHLRRLKSMEKRLCNHLKMHVEVEK